MLTDSQVSQLSGPLDKSLVKTRSQGSQTLSYIEGWQAIKTANSIFGFGNWSQELVKCTCVSDVETDNKHFVTYTAVVRITVWPLDAPGGPQIVREGIGCGSGLGMRQAGNAHESASKEAATDAMKRALITFGNPFGLALYDKEQKDVQEIIVDPEIDEDHVPDPEVAPNEAVGKKWKFVTAAQEQKLRVGSAAYYEALASFQLNKSTDIKPGDTKTMNAVIKALKAMPDEDGE